MNDSNNFPDSINAFLECDNLFVFYCFVYSTRIEKSYLEINPTIKSKSITENSGPLLRKFIKYYGYL